MEIVGTLPDKSGANEYAAERPSLDARLESVLPPRVAVGAANALFVSGWCFSADGSIRELHVGPPGGAVRALAHGMPRPDVLRALSPDSRDDPRQRSYRSGFWAIVPLAAVPGPTSVELRVEARLADGRRASAGLGTVDLAPGLYRQTESQNGARPSTAGIAICMATFEPPIELFERQIESIRAQSETDWQCFISDDQTTQARFAELERVIGDDPRFVVSRSERHLGHYHNFERALSLAPTGTRHVMLCDQDDRWHPDKIATLRRALGDATLVYSDARVVDRDGNRISDTYWSQRRNNYTNLASLLIANTVTGAAALFRRDLLDVALPFPPRHGEAFHDHWLAIVALTTGRIAYVDRPLYDYVQHRHAALGHARANAGAPRARSLIGRLLRVAGNPRQTFGRWRTIYFYDLCRIALFAMVIERRAGGTIPARKRHALRRVIGSERSLAAAAWLAARRARRLIGRNETMGAEGALLRGVVWRRLIAGLAAERRPFARIRGNAKVPRLARPSGPSAISHAATRTLGEKVRPLELDVRADAPRRVNLLVPTIDLEHFFGGYLAKLNLARRLAERGLQVRIVTVDETPPLPREWRRKVEAYQGLHGVFDRVEIAFGREDAPLVLSPTDALIATTWWTAHIASAALESLERERFVYLIQEYEPFTFPMGALAALARQSYDLPHFALFSTELLREWFRENRLGVFAAERGEDDSVAFENALTPIVPPIAAELAVRRSRRLLFYARPEPHAARNMFELGLLALSQAVGERLLTSEWELHGVGTVEGPARIELGDGIEIELLPRRDQDSYAELLRGHDVGLALMYTPHPSLVPIEMASAGMLTVTNSFENKTAEKMAAISPNLLAFDPSLSGISAALREAIGAVDDYERRADGAKVRWSRDWNQSFDDRLLERVERYLEDC